MQRFYDERETGMHFQIGKGGGYHHCTRRPRTPGEAARREPWRSAAIPLLMLAAMMPLPEGLPETAFVGLLRGKGDGSLQGA